MKRRATKPAEVEASPGATELLALPATTLRDLVLDTPHLRLQLDLNQVPNQNIFWLLSGQHLGARWVEELQPALQRHREHTVQYEAVVANYLATSLMPPAVQQREDLKAYLGWGRTLRLQSDVRTDNYRIWTGGVRTVTLYAHRGVLQCRRERNASVFPLTWVAPQIVHKFSKPLHRYLAVEVSSGWRLEGTEPQEYVTPLLSPDQCAWVATIRAAERGLMALGVPTDLRALVWGYLEDDE